MSETGWCGELLSSIRLPRDQGTVVWIMLEPTCQGTSRTVWRVSWRHRHKKVDGVLGRVQRPGPFSGTTTADRTKDFITLRGEMDSEVLPLRLFFERRIS